MEQPHTIVKNAATTYEPRQAIDYSGFPISLFLIRRICLCLWNALLLKLKDANLSIWPINGPASFSY